MQSTQLFEHPANCLFQDEYTLRDEYTILLEEYNKYYKEDKKTRWTALRSFIERRFLDGALAKCLAFNDHNRHGQYHWRVPIFECIISVVRGKNINPQHLKNRHIKLAYRTAQYIEEYRKPLLRDLLVDRSSNAFEQFIQVYAIFRTVEKVVRGHPIESLRYHARFTGAIQNFIKVKKIDTNTILDTYTSFTLVNELSLFLQANNLYYNGTTKKLGDKSANTVKIQDNLHTASFELEEKTRNASEKPFDPKHAPQYQMSDMANTVQSNILFDPYTNADTLKSSFNDTFSQIKDRDTKIIENDFRDDKNNVSSLNSRVSKKAQKQGFTSGGNERTTKSKVSKTYTFYPDEAHKESRQKKQVTKKKEISYFDKVMNDAVLEVRLKKEKPTSILASLISHNRDDRHHEEEPLNVKRPPISQDVPGEVALAKKQKTQQILQHENVPGKNPNPDLENQDASLNAKHPPISQGLPGEERQLTYREYALRYNKYYNQFCSIMHRVNEFWQYRPDGNVKFLKECIKKIKGITDVEVSDDEDELPSFSQQIQQERDQNQQSRGNGGMNF